MIEFEQILVTTALPYSNGEIHLGHIVSTYLPADVFTRFHRSFGNKVYHIGGTDDYGTPILIKAEQEGVTPEAYVQKWWERDYKDFTDLGISFDIFHKTHSPENKKLVQHYFVELNKKGFIYKKTIEHPYCPKDKKFLPDRYLKVTCPYCGKEDQYSDSCENCGRTINASDVKVWKCSLCGTEPVQKSTEHYFFKLGEFSNQLREWLDGSQELQPEVKNYVLQWIKEGLRDWDITRDISWGVPIPGDEKKVFYGWFDNHIGYISFTLKLLGEQEGTKFWNSSKIYHFIGKDIAYHHLLFLPAMRMGVGEHALPYGVPTRGYLTIGGQKLSKSRGHYISVREFLTKYPADYLRYYFSAVTPYSTGDVNFDWKEFEERINNELVATFGNFFYRVLSFAEKTYKGKLPKAHLDEEDMGFVNTIREAVDEVGKLLTKGETLIAFRKIAELGAAANQYFQRNQPWKAEPKRRDTAVYVGACTAHSLAILLWPFLPHSMEKLWKQLGLQGHPTGWSRAKELLPEGHQLGKAEPLYQKVEIKPQ